MASYVRSYDKKLNNSTTNNLWDSIHELFNFFEGSVRTCL